MKHITDFSISVSLVGDQCLAEISKPDFGYPIVLMSAHLSSNLAMTEEATRYFALKNFCGAIGDELRAVLERMDIALT